MKQKYNPIYKQKTGSQVWKSRLGPGDRLHILPTLIIIHAAPPSDILHLWSISIVDFKSPLILHKLYFCLFRCP